MSARIGRNALPLFLALLGGCQVQPGAAPSAEHRAALEHAIVAAHLQTQTAAEALDAQALYRGVLEECNTPIVQSGKASASRQEALDKTQEGFRGMKSMAYFYQHHSITEVSPTAALWVGEGVSTAVLEDGRTVTSPFAETIVYVQRDGQWKILHAHFSTPPRPQ